MPAFYFDTSGLVKRYATELGTAWVLGLTDPRTGNDPFTVRLTGPELVAALFRKVRIGAASQLDMERAAANFLTDWQGQYEIVEATADLAEQAMQLVQRHPLRGYDAVHLAAALTADTSTSAGRARASHSSPPTATSCRPRRAKAWWWTTRTTTSRKAGQFRVVRFVPQKGVALQNITLMLRFPETTAPERVPVYP